MPFLMNYYNHRGILRGYPVKSLVGTFVTTEVHSTEYCSLPIRCLLDFLIYFVLAIFLNWSEIHLVLSWYAAMATV